MKLIPLIGALLFSAAPVQALERKEDYYYGLVIGVGNTLCGLVVDKLIKKEYAQNIYLETVKMLKMNAKPYASAIDMAYKEITVYDVCKEVYQ